MERGLRLVLVPLVSQVLGVGIFLCLIPSCATVLTLTTSVANATRVLLLHKIVADNDVTVPATVAWLLPAKRWLIALGAPHPSLA
jgi:hypothetical protein